MAARIDPQEIYVYLRSLGVSEAMAAGILANIRAESSFNPGAEGDTNLSTSSFGLFQWRESRFTNLQNYASSQGTDWTDWQTQIRFALQEATAMGIDLQQTDAVAASREWTIRFERPADAQRKADERAQYVSQYEYGEPENLNVATTTTTNEELNLPTGGSWFLVDGQYYIAYRFYGVEGGPSSVVYYKHGGAPPQGTTIHSASSWYQYSPGWQDGGDSDALRGIPQGTSYQQLVDDTLFRLGLSGSDALQDQGVMDVIALAMTREMSEVELRDRLQQTDYWNQRTNNQREWSGLSDAEKALRIVDEAMKLSSLWFTYVGQDLDVAAYDTDGDGQVSSAELQAGNPALYDWATRIASGESTQVQAVNVWIKEEAGLVEESPWSRTLRDEEKAKGEHGVSVSTTSGQIKDLYNQWGVPISDARAEELAEEVVMNRLSLEDVEEELKTQANGLYPHKPPNMPTMEWAQPYKQTYMQTLEIADMGLDDATLSQALSDGTSLSEFRIQLRNDDRWLETQGARDEMNGKISQMGRVMGF